jgi:hypothetical protein
MNTPQPRTQFALQSRILHWLMAVMILAMLFIGVTMVASLGDYHVLLAIHRPLGILILILTAIRFINRICTKLPPFPPTMSPSGKVPGFIIREAPLRSDVCPAPCRLEHVIRRPLSYRDVRASTSAANSSGNPDSLFRIAQSAYDFRVSPVLDVSRPPQRGAVPHPYHS